MAISGLVAIYVAFHAPYSFRFDLYVHHSPWMAGATWCLVAIAVYARLAQNRTGNVLADTLFAAVLMAVIAVAIPGRALIEADASNMVSTALGITFDGSAIGPASGVYLENGELYVTESKVDKRGVFFPFAMAALNWTIGYDADHGVLVNLMAGWCSLLLVARISRRFLPTPGVMTSVLCMAAFPLFALHARSGTFDTLSLAFLLLTLHAVTSFFLDRSRTALWLAVTAGAALAQLRYEAGAVAGLLVISMLIAIAFNRRFARLRRPELLFAPFLFVPSGLRRVLPFNYELPPGREIAWSVEYFIDNSTMLADYLLRGGAETASGNAYVVALCGLGVCALAWRWRSVGVNASPVFAFVALPIIVLTAIQLFYFWGTPILPQTVRYFLPVIGLVSIMAGTIVVLCSTPRIQWVGSLAGLMLLLNQLVAGYKSNAFDGLTYVANTGWLVTRYSETNIQCHAILVTDSALPLLVRGFSILSPERASELTAAEEINAEENKIWTLPNLYITQPDHLHQHKQPAAPAKCQNRPSSLRPRLAAPMPLYIR